MDKYIFYSLIIGALVGIFAGMAVFLFLNIFLIGSILGFGSAFILKKFNPHAKKPHANLVAFAGWLMSFILVLIILYSFSIHDKLELSDPLLVSIPEIRKSGQCFTYNEVYDTYHLRAIPCDTDTECKAFVKKYGENIDWTRCMPAEWVEFQIDGIKEPISCKEDSECLEKIYARGLTNAFNNKEDFEVIARRELYKCGNRGFCEVTNWTLAQMTGKLN